jgi:serine/threonine protein kinase
MSQVECPEQDEIAAYIVGTVDDNRLPAVEEHLSNCPQCRAVADKLESSVSDPLLDLLKGPEPADAFSDEPECQQVLPKIKRIGDTLFGSSDTNRETANDDEILLPCQLGEYHVLEHIGGHMGRVYKALHTTMNRLVAIKVLPAGALADQQAVDRFEQEMKAVGPLEHPNIVRAYDARQIEGKPVLVMELVRGHNLSQVLDANGPFRVADACEVIRQAAVGLQFAHEKGIVHRDVKPSNLMLTSEGQVKVLDLGLARLRGRGLGAKEMTGAGQALGTPICMAPEQITDSRRADTRADVYGLGCTLYKLLSGRAPYDDPRHEHAVDILTAHLAEPIPSIKAARPDVPDELAAVVNRMLAKSPSDRFEDPGQVATALKPFTVSSDLRALMSRRIPPPPPDSQSRWLWKLLAVAAALLLIVGGKMAIEQLAPYWSGKDGTSLARRPEQAPEKPGQDNSSAPMADEHHATGQGPSAAATAGQQPQPKSESPEATVPPRPAQPDEGAPPIPATGDNRTKPSPAESGGHVAPAQPNPPPAKPPVLATPTNTAPPKPPAQTPDPDVLTTVHNPRAAFVVDVEVDHADRIYRGPPTGSDGKGEVLHVTVESSKPGYLYLIYRAADGSLKCLYPNKIQRDNKIAADKIVAVPHPDAKFRLRVGPPYGKELLKAIVTLTPRKPEDFGVRSFTEGDVTPLRTAALKNVFVELEKNPADWAEHQVEITTTSGEAVAAPVETPVQVEHP